MLKTCDESELAETRAGIPNGLKEEIYPGCYTI